jgi:hypothetical protein
MTINLAYQIYAIVGPLVCALVILMGYRSERPELARCGIVVLVQLLAAHFWSYFMMAGPWAGQPYGFHIIATGLASYFILRQPAGRLQAILGGVTFATFAYSCVHAIRGLWIGYQAGADLFYWFLLFGMGCAEIIILVGWSNAEIGRNSFIYCRAAIARFLGSDAKGGMG